MHNNQPMIKHVNIKIFGRVQGVGFRYFIKQRANKAGLKGFVQNQQDGAVYLEIEGKGEEVDKLIKWCHKGSPWSKISRVDVRKDEVREFSDFSVQQD